MDVSCDSSKSEGRGGGGASIQLLESVFLGDDKGCGPQGRYHQAGSQDAGLVTQFFLHPVAAFGGTGSSWAARNLLQGFHMPLPEAVGPKPF